MATVGTLLGARRSIVARCASASRLSPTVLHRMAIMTGGLLGSSRNKVGSIVTFRLKGQDVARSLAPSVANPRTRAQMEQRVKLANLVAMYRANRPWMDGLAFETRPQKWSDYNAFVSANIADNVVCLKKSEAAAGTCIVAPYRVTEGTLPSIMHNAASANQWETNLYIGSLSLTNASVAQVTNALLENNNGLTLGMQLSLIVNYQQQINGIYSVIVRYFEVILDNTDNRIFTDLMSEEHITKVGTSIGFAAGGSDPVMGFTFVLSKDEAGKTRVSSQNMVLTDTDLYDLFAAEIQQNAAINSYGGGLDNPFLAAGYQDGSNGNVNVPISILSVNDATDGDYIGTGTANSARFIVRFNQLVSEPQSVGITAGGTTYSSVGQSPSLSFTHSGNLVHIDSSGMGSSNSSIVTEIKVTIDSIDYKINFRSTDDVTE